MSTSSSRRLGVLVLLATVSAASLARDARAACTTAPSATHFCVTFDEGAEAYGIDDGTGPATKRTLSMTVGTAYAFEIDPADQGDFVSHPFYLTDHPMGASLGKNLTNPVTTGTVSFTPTPTTPAQSYYQCADHVLMGGLIEVDGGAEAGPPSTSDDAGSHGGHHADAGVPQTPSPDPAPNEDGGRGASAANNDANAPPAASDGGGCATTTSQPASGALAAMFLGAMVTAAGLLRRRTRQRR